MNGVLAFSWNARPPVGHRTDEGLFCMSTSTTLHRRWLSPGNRRWSCGTRFPMQHPQVTSAVNVKRQTHWKQCVAMLREKESADEHVCFLQIKNNASRVTESPMSCVIVYKDKRAATITWSCQTRIGNELARQPSIKLRSRAAPDVQPVYEGCDGNLTSNEQTFCKLIPNGSLVEPSSSTP